MKKLQNVTMNLEEDSTNLWDDLNFFDALPGEHPDTFDNIGCNVTIVLPILSKKVENAIKNIISGA